VGKLFFPDLAEWVKAISPRRTRADFHYSASLAILLSAEESARHSSRLIETSKEICGIVKFCLSFFR